MARDPCSLCGQDAEWTPGPGDQHWVECATCGLHGITGLLRRRDFDQSQLARRHILSYLTRAASDAGSWLIISQENIDALLGSVAEFPPLEKMDRALIYVNHQQARPDQGVDIELAKDFPLVMARDAD